MATLKLTYRFDTQGFMNDQDYYGSDPDVRVVSRSATTYDIEFLAYDETTHTAETVDGPVHLNDLAETALEYTVKDRVE